MAKEFDYEVVKTYGSLSESSKGWKKEIKLISWNQKEPKYDIREWSPDGEKMGKGVTLSKEELVNLTDEELLRLAEELEDVSSAEKNQQMAIKILL